jgi:CheY-like chemotaxis protein
MSSPRGLADRDVVLVVDDHDDTREMVAEMLAWTGAHAIRVKSVPQALGVLRGARVDVIVTDYAMPGVDGLAFVRLLRQHESEALRSVPVIMLSGQATESVQREVAALGATYLAKPMGIELLAGTIDSVLGRSSHARTG